VSPAGLCGGGLYCPPLIPARIRRNPGNSWNSRGIKFGRGTCQIDKTIPAEFRTEFKFRRNGSRNHPDRITPERNPRNMWSAQRCPNRVLAFADARFGHHQQPQTFFPPNHHLHPPPPPSFTTPAQCPRVDSFTNGRHHAQPSPTAPNDHGTPQHRKNNNTTPRHAANERRPGATSPTNNGVNVNVDVGCCLPNERRQTSSFVFVYFQLHPPPPTLFL
jgi:hypothetical protein